MRLRYWLLAILFMLASAAWFFRGEIFGWYQNVRMSLPVIEQFSVGDVIKEIKEEINLPPPLRSLVKAPESYLTQAGTMAETNRQRAQNGLSALKENAKLYAAARAKAEDLFKRQYFEHQSPTGEGPDDVARAAGYEFIVIGENLALGNYKDDAALVQAWMDSPGHRANILNARYSEIGVAVARGTYEGEETWIAVQEFGLPLSACPSPSAALKQSIQNNEAQLKTMAAALEAERAELEKSRPKDRPEFNEKVQAYNALAEEYNALLKKVKALIAQYNSQVEAFNACVEG